VNVRVRFFAVARELAGADQVELSVEEPCTVAGLRRTLAGRFPALEQVLPHVLFAVDSNYVRDDSPLAAGCEVACIPPVSGG
jgi:molybdopterin converting factor subunit 1